MPYHHNNGFRVPRLLVVTAALVLSVGIGAITGHILSGITAADTYASAVKDINRRIESQLRRTGAYSVAAREVAVARTYVETATTYQASLTALDKLYSSLNIFNDVILKECPATSEHLATVDVSPVTGLNRIPSSVREGFANLQETAAEGEGCNHAHSLVAYNNFSAFTLSAAVNVKQITTTGFTDESALKNLQAAVNKAPGTAELRALERKYGTDFTGYAKAHNELAKSYASIPATKTTDGLTPYSERIKQHDKKLQSLYDKSAKAYNDASQKDSKASLEKTNRLYSEALVINKMPGGPQVNELQLSGLILVNAIALYPQENGAYPLSPSLNALLTTLKDKGYITDTSQFSGLHYSADSPGTYKLTVPATSGDIAIIFTDKNPQPDKRTQTFKVRT